MKLHTIHAGHFMCDGGALFGVIPKKMWSKLYEVDADNYCKASLRCLLIDTVKRRILIDTGIGTKQGAKFLSHSRLFGDDELISSLHKVGYQTSDITDVLLTHLHFDHCGECVTKDEDGQLQLTFENATYWVSQKQWNTYLNPNVREGAVYFPENMMPVFEANKLQLIKSEGAWLPEVDIKLFDGHTDGQIVPIIHTPNGLLAYMGDFIPVTASINPFWVAAYDIQPIVSIEEKKQFLNEAISKNINLYFEHDYYTECCSLTSSPKGVSVGKTFSLEEFMR